MTFADIRKMKAVFSPKQGAFTPSQLFWLLEVMHSFQRKTKVDFGTTVTYGLRQGLRPRDIILCCPEDNLEPRKPFPLSECSNNWRHRYQPTT